MIFSQKSRADAAAALRARVRLPRAAFSLLQIFYSFSSNLRQPSNISPLHQSSSLQCRRQQHKCRKIHIQISQSSSFRTEILSEFLGFFLVISRTENSYLTHCHFGGKGASRGFGFPLPTECTAAETRIFSLRLWSKKHAKRDGDRETLSAGRLSHVSEPQNEQSSDAEAEPQQVLRENRTCCGKLLV